MKKTETHGPVKDTQEPVNQEEVAKILRQGSITIKCTYMEHGVENKVVKAHRSMDFEGLSTYEVIGLLKATLDSYSAGR